MPKLWGHPKSKVIQIEINSWTTSSHKELDTAALKLEDEKLRR
jgi:hypothetical protein